MVRGDTQRQVAEKNRTRQKKVDFEGGPSAYDQAKRDKHAVEAEAKRERACEQARDIAASLTEIDRRARRWGARRGKGLAHEAREAVEDLGYQNTVLEGLISALPNSPESPGADSPAANPSRLPSGQRNSNHSVAAEPREQRQVRRTDGNTYDNVSRELQHHDEEINRDHIKINQINRIRIEQYVKDCRTHGEITKLVRNLADMTSFASFQSGEIKALKQTLEETEADQAKVLEENAELLENTAELQVDKAELQEVKAELLEVKEDKAELQEVNAKLLAELQEVKAELLEVKADKEEQRREHAEELTCSEEVWVEEYGQLKAQLLDVKAELRARDRDAADAARLYG